jgi:putative ABC transport system permease protein
VGRLDLPVTRVLTYEPDRGGDLFRLAPRVMINTADLEATGLVTPASRVEHRLLVAGPAPEISGYADWLRANLTRGEDLETIKDARPELRVALDRAQRFLGLAALVAVLLGGAAIAVAARHFAERQADAGAVMRCLGASRAQVLGLYTLRLLWLGLLGSLLGTLIGLGAQEVLAQLLGQWFSAGLPPPGLRPVLTGLLTGPVVLLGFALPPVLRLGQVPPLRVLRRDLPMAPPSAWMVGGVAFTAMAGLMLWQAQDLKLALMVIGGTLGTVVVLGGVAWGLIGLLRRYRRGGGLGWRFGLAGLARRGISSVVQLTAIGLGIMALLLLAIVRVDLLESWERNLPEGAPNHFLINVQPDDVEPLRVLFAESGHAPPEFYPMVRGRLVSIGDRAVGPDDYANPRAQRLVSREFNLSWAEELQSDNDIVAGEWWGAGDGDREFSVEAGIAETLGIRLGDTLRFQVGGELAEAVVTNLRSVEWDSFNVNFFVVAPPGVLDEFPAQYITSFYAEGDVSDLLVGAVRQFPSVTVLDVRALMDQVRSIMDRATLAVEFVFLFTLLAGLMVLYAAIEATHEERRREGAILRTLGARRGQVLRGIAAEFAGLGLLAGLLAAAAASALGLGLATQVFELDYQLNPWLWLVGAASGTIGVALAGLAGTRRVLNQAPLLVLRQR